MTFGLHYYLINITANFPIISTSSRFRAINTHLMFHIFSAKHSAKKTAKLIMFFFFFWHFLGDFAGLCTIVLKRNKPSDSADLFSGEKKALFPRFYLDVHSVLIVSFSPGHRARPPLIIQHDSLKSSVSNLFKSPGGFCVTHFKHHPSVFPLKSPRCTKAHP